MADEWHGYRALARAVVRGAVMNGRPREAIDFVTSENGRMWLDWLRIEPDAVERVLRQSPVRSRRKAADNG